ncbi:flagellar motor protein MotB [Hephaestia mangrovi]|uniref:flagellar motor protein MotB n=1 Tax=Hephaestia mangrovi TaxID=2873268 RepID=UPI001CA6956B|nr:flagellar motor protein MotB [Hephaestia mangrovi]MBY8829287.1 OmpA family protein [Hephaestia mangrovi]
MAARAPHGSNQPPKIIVKKIFVEGHGGHHGGAWKVAYADFVTAMMAFFLLLWLLGATTEKQRKSLADYFAPTLVTMRENSAGSHGLFGGESITDKDHYPHRAQQTGTRSMTIPVDAAGGNQVGSGQKGTLKNKAELAKEDTANFSRMHRQIEQEIGNNPKLKGLAKHVHFVRTRDGLRIDLLDDADYSMFALGTTQLEPAADKLLGLIAESIKGSGNPIMIRGHTDSLRYGDPKTMNNWMLSTGRAEATRQRLAAAGVPEDRFDRIEGVADREPMIAGNPADPRNRRIAITLLYRRGVFGQ